jgi:hypothetical protein
MTPASAQMTSVQHIILVTQENRQIAGDVMRRQRFRWVRVVMAVVAFAAMTIESASAHDKGCDGNPAPGEIKLDCCGKADEHRLKPEQVSRGRNELWRHSSTGGVRGFVVNYSISSSPTRTCLLPLLVK